MASPLVLERPGAWRFPILAVILLLPAAPGAPLLLQALATFGEAPSGVGAAFGRALGNSAVVAFLVAALAFAAGLPAGICLALYAFPGRTILFASLALPLLLPSFLWAIGWSSLAARLGAGGEALSGLGGCVLVFSGPSVALVAMASWAAARSLSGSQVDSARLAGGERTVFLHASRHVASLALVAAALGGVLTLQDPGPGQILGLQTAASEILTGFSALFDLALAGRQCAALTAAVLVVAGPLAWLAAPRLASQVLARQTRRLRPLRHRAAGAAAAAGLGAATLLWVALPLGGLALPLGRETRFARAWSEVARTGGDTLLYAAGGGLVAVGLAFLAALAAGRSARLRALVVGGALLLFALPSALPALGILELGARAPPWADPLLRGPFVVCAVLGLRFLPAAVVVALRAWGSTSPTWTLAAACCGVPLARYTARVLLPLLSPALAVALLVVALLGTADVSTVLLLAPPGRASLPLAIFTIMANAPESLVASLCLVHVALAAGGLVAVAELLARRGG